MTPVSVCPLSPSKMQKLQAVTATDTSAGELPFVFKSSPVYLYLHLSLLPSAVHVFVFSASLLLFYITSSEVSQLCDNNN